VTRCTLPERKGIQVLASIGEGKRVSPYYDNMVAQIICHGADRTDAIAGLRAYLDEVHIGGIATNLPLLRRILDDTVFRSGDYDTRYLPRLLERIDIDALCAESAATADSATARLSTESLRIEGSDELKVLAPSAGVFYVTPSPGDPDLVRVGDVVDAQQKLCLLEAMKLFSPLNLASFNQAARRSTTRRAATRSSASCRRQASPSMPATCCLSSGRSRRARQPQSCRRTAASASASSVARSSAASCASRSCGVARSSGCRGMK
jgi:hypothetical protein